MVSCRGKCVIETNKLPTSAAINTFFMLTLFNDVAKHNPNDT